MSTPRGLFPDSNLKSGESQPVSETILQRSDRQAQVRFETSAQTLADQAASQFLSGATDWKTLASLMAGSLAYRMGKIGVMGSGFWQILNLPLQRALSVAFGLGSEVTAFEFTSRTLSSLHARAGLKPTPTPNLWSWSGHGGWKEGLLSSLINFSLLKGVGHLARRENFILRQIFPATAMVTGHQVSGALKIVPGPEGSIPEQFAQAVMTNLQMGAGISLGHALSGGRLLALEKGMDLHTHLNFGGLIHPLVLKFSPLATARAAVDIGMGNKENPPSLFWMSRPKETQKRGPQGSELSSLETASPEIRDRIEKIQRASSPFFRVIDARASLKFQENLETLKGPPRESLERHDLALVLSHEAAPSIEQGFDPMITIHNTGSSVVQMSEIIQGASGGRFPVTILSEINSHDYVAGALRAFALKRKMPYFSILIRLPASELAEWASQNRRVLFEHSAPHGEGHNLPANRISSLMKVALESGSVSILSLPGTPPWKSGFIFAALEKAGFPKSLLVEGKGENFGEALRRNYEGQLEAAKNWAKVLIDESQQSKEDLVEGWMDFIQSQKNDKTPKSPLELGDWILEQCLHYHLPLPSNLLIRTIFSKLSDSSPQNPPSSDISRTPGGLAALLAAGSGIATLFSSGPLQAAVDGVASTGGETWTLSLLGLGTLTLLGMAIGKKNSGNPPREKIIVEDASSETELREKLKDSMKEFQDRQLEAFGVDPSETTPPFLPSFDREGLYQRARQGEVEAVEVLASRAEMDPELLQDLLNLSQEVGGYGTVKSAALEALADLASKGSEKAIEHLKNAAETDELAVIALGELARIDKNVKAILALTELSKTDDRALESLWEFVDSEEDRGFELLCEVAKARSERDPQDPALTNLFFNLHIRALRKSEGALKALYQIGHFHPSGGKYLHHMFLMFGPLPEGLEENPKNWTDPKVLKVLYEGLRENLKNFEKELRKARRKKTGPGRE
jgi:hypothetical protein